MSSPNRISPPPAPPAQSPPPPEPAPAPTPQAITAELLIRAVQQITPAERVKYEALSGFPLPVIPEGETGGERVYGARCPKCGEVALEFLGRDNPEGQRWEEARWVQDKGRHKTMNMKRHAPICQFCNSCVAQGKIRDKHVVELEEYSKFRAAQKGRRKRLHGVFRLDKSEGTLVDHEGRTVTLPKTEITDLQAIQQGKPRPKMIDTRDIVAPRIGEVG